ncbi:hypothetical protein AC578_1670 [Pseudocercospora eumusae]|uniref:non-specific serine/threonine protein kinase n=1 Tax=Pseudocercospora eumusae TaxID=321146 RepID=A0A139GXF8_9PEZI|nr:hypothetical protein AC578_1670 [Pseudocercospora eumusae]
MPPPGRGLSTKEIVVSLLLLAGTAALQKPAQHQHYPHPNPHPIAQKGDGRADDAQAKSQWQAHAHAHAHAADPSLQHHLAGQRGHHDTNANVINNEGHQTNVNRNDNDRKEKARRTPYVNERALATVSPAESDPAVRAPPAQWSASSNGGDLTSRQLPARSLQDWQVEEMILLATVDGKLHARDRRTGAHRWTVENTHDMVENINHPHNKTLNPDGSEQETPIFIVEPSQDGAIYILAPEHGLTRLESPAGAITVKTLAEMSPYAAEDSNVVYTAEKRNRLYTINAQNGQVEKTFTSTGSVPGEDSSCRRVDPLGGLADDNELETLGFITLGQTEYTIGIQNRVTGEPISTIRYFEWSTNNRDQDLRNSYSSTLDRRNLYSTWDGHFYSLHDDPENPKAEFWGKLNAPIARVYDLIRPVIVRPGPADLVALQQPLGRIPPGAAGADAVYVNRTEKSNWYALSERHYPTVTDKARPVEFLDRAKFANLDVAGVYNSPTRILGPRAIDGGVPYTIDAPPSSGDQSISRGPADQWPNEYPTLPSVQRQNGYLSVQYLMLAFITLLCVGAGPYAVKNLDSLRKLMPVSAAKGIPGPISEPLQVQVDLPPQAPTDPVPEPTTPLVREGEPAEEIIFPHESPTANGTATPKVRFAADSAVQAGEESPEGEDQKDEPKKKKATRGRRGGRKQKEKEAAQAEARARKNGSDTSQTQSITITASESTSASGPVQINSLIVHLDKVIGNGSGGTTVYEGMFENRRVAVKRMLSQYCELASQEVSFLQQSDDHDNVVRYFCQQKDNHFLYLAVELCQASLFEVWEVDKPKSEKALIPSDERRVQLSALKLAIQRDMARTLKQLAQGLNHLHNLRIIHRDIKPQNILVAFPRKTQPAGTTRLVISDFGLGKNLPEGMSTINDLTGNAGTFGWKAPELITQPCDVESNHSKGASTNGSDGGSGGGVSGLKRAADIFSLGCLFFWVLTDGAHPFEDESMFPAVRELNVKKDKKNMEPLERWSDAYEPLQLIGSMLANEPANRPTAHEVLNHPYFWEPEDRLSFLCDCSDHFEREQRGTWEDNYIGDSPHLQLLESRMFEIVGPNADFLSKLDKVFVDTLGKQRKYSGNRVLDLLRALRNKKNHYEDMPDHVKKLVGPLAAGYLAYWTRKFPRLLMACYEVVREAKLERSDRFKRYLEL